jgi:hypothetical protein
VLEICETTIAGWTEAWGLPGLERTVALVESPRLRVALARCDVKRRQIRVHPELSRQPAALRAAVLCHELAHIAAHQLHGAAIRPHGSEWRALMVTAGFPPTTHLGLTPGPAPAPVAAGPAPAPVAAGPAPARMRYRHRCPVCQMVRWARRPVPRWRCRACVEAGLSGLLLVETPADDDRLADRAELG